MSSVKFSLFGELTDRSIQVHSVSIYIGAACKHKEISLHQQRLEKECC